MASKKQVYENYWKLTLEYTDINGYPFRKTLKLIVNFIDNKICDVFSTKKYNQLQKLINQKFPKQDMGSVRKSINQFVKLGFINSKLLSYHEDTKKFLDAKTNEARQSIFSKIVYTNSSFNKSVINNSNQKELNFLIKTLEENKKLHKRDIVALMKKDISKITKGYLNKRELTLAKNNADKTGFIDRKYNQVSYLWGLLKKLDDLEIKDDYLYFSDDPILLHKLARTDNKRDPYLHKIYKNQLKQESKKHFKNIMCMVENLDYPTLIASHIKRFVDSTENEAYDPNNGILLSQNMDGLFDKGYISFEDNGNIIISNKISKTLKDSLKKYKLDNAFLTEDRKKYLNIHRDSVYKNS